MPGAVLADNLARIRDRIDEAATRAGRDVNEITLVAVTKTQSADTVQQALALGLTELGENYVQETLAKRAGLGRDQTNRARWHLLGHLQSNKARLAVQTYDLIQSVDNTALAASLSRQAAALGKTQGILLQVHLGNEATKFGLAAEQVRDAAAGIATLPGLSVRGLMGIAPQDEDARPFFRLLRQLFDDLPASTRQVLSMGMTGDFETAIEEGATLVRIGTALFGSRPARH